MATVNDEQQTKGNLGGPDLFLAPIGRLDAEKITKYFCNTCEKEFEGPPKIEFENPNEEVAENLILAEKGQYICSACSASIAEYREFKKQNELEDIGSAKPLDDSHTESVVAPQETAVQPEEQKEDTAAVVAEIASPQETVVQPESTEVNPVTLIEGKTVYDENANKIGTAKQVGIDSTQTMVLVMVGTDNNTEFSVPWTNIRKIGEVVLLGRPEDKTQQQLQQEDTASSSKCVNCGFANKAGSKFCEECGNKIT